CLLFRVTYVACLPEKILRRILPALIQDGLLLPGNLPDARINACGADIDRTELLIRHVALSVQRLDRQVIQCTDIAPEVFDAVGRNIRMLVEVGDLLRALELQAERMRVGGAAVE